MRNIYKFVLLMSIGALTLVLAAIALRRSPSWLSQEILHPNDGSVYQQVTGDAIEEARTKWDEVFDTTQYIYGKSASLFLQKNWQKLPKGLVLDIAMAEGRNAVYLARKGFQVEGVDISEVALRKARRLARENHVSIKTINADLNDYKIPPGRYDVILNSNFLLRSLIPQIKRGLKKGGYIVFENATVEQLKNPKSFPRDWLLELGELKKWFSDYEIIFYEESNDGDMAMARLIAKKPY